VIRRIVAYLLLVHLVLATMALLVLTHSREWLFAVEALFVLSLILGFLVLRSVRAPLELVRTGAGLLADQDFASRFRETGQTEVDTLVRVYNAMLERLRQERLRLEEQHLFLDRVLTASPSGMLTLDLEKRVDYMNPAAERILGVSRDAALGRHLAEIGPALAVELDGIAVGESAVRALHGARRVRCARIEYLERGFPRSFFLIEELTEELRASEKSAYHKLIRMMSHEVNNSAGAVRSLLGSFAAYARHLPADDRRDFDDALGVAGTRLANLTSFMNGFADVVRLPDPERRPCDLRRLLEDLRVLLRPELERRQIRWVWDASVELPPISLDKNQIEQVLVNVLHNACQAIGEGGAIRVSLSRDEGRPRLTIRDDGPGIAPEVRALLFTPFFTTKPYGRGLGLVVAQEILSRHGFAFGLDGVAGQGATFWVRF
jgi:two-component system, NtrC family, nitrogen regulation sensor histidine kinase NtrY